MTLTAKGREALKNWEITDAASAVLDYDINPEDYWNVECFLRERYPQIWKDGHEILPIGKRCPKITEQFVRLVANKAKENLNLKIKHGLFDLINHNVQAWPKEPDDEFNARIVDDVAIELRRLADQHNDDDWRQDNLIETKAARYAALLLIKQAAWRHFDDAMTEGMAAADAERPF